MYKARDSRLGRLVAVKTLSAEKLTDREWRRRFLAEAQAASRLNHPNIITIYDILENNGMLFIAMEYVVGRTLDLIGASGRIPLQTALKYAGEIADGLAAAHVAGIIHRDLKPANIMISDDGRVKLLDFGLAKLVESERSADETKTESQLTQTGAIVGTAAYMSPEQAQGQPLDTRSDIFAFGAVVYEMLSGQRAFGGPTWLSTLAAILHSEPRPLFEVNPEITPALETQVERCLRKNPSDRFQTMAEVKDALERVVTSEVVVSHRGAEKVGLQSIAVLPFTNFGADKENDYFGDGLAEEIINALSKISQLRVIARTSAFAFRGKEHDLRTIGKRLQVGTILEGSIRRAGSRIRITAQLVSITDESQLWSERYDRELTDIFAIQDEISESIAAALKVKLVGAIPRTRNIEAYQNYLKGLYFYQRYNAESLLRARESFEEALHHDPGFAPAHAGLAVFYYGLGAVGIKRMTDMAPLAKAAAAQSLAIDSTLSEAHSVLGLIAGSVAYDWKLAKHHFQAAMETNPVPALVRVRYALYFLTPLQKFDEAMAEYKLALETDPLSMMVHFGLGFTLYCQGLYDEAFRHATKTLELFPEYWLLLFLQGMALSHKGMLGESIYSLEANLRLAPTFTLAAGFLAAAYARLGKMDRAEKLMTEMATKQPEQYVSSASFAIFAAASGRQSEMFMSLENAWAERDPYLTRIDAEPYFAPFRSDSRFRALLEKMNLPARVD